MQPSTESGSGPLTAPVGSAGPVARVAVDVAHPHLDRPFDYLIPPEWDAAVVPGCRVRVRFAGRLLSGYVLGRVGHSEHPGRLAPLHRLVSGEPVLSAEIAGLARAVADRMAGSLADVLRLAVPPRHAAVETDTRATPHTAGSPPDPPEPGGWSRYPTGPAYLDVLAAGRSPRAVWWALPGEDWPALLATAVAATLAGGRGAVVVAPDARDVARLDRALGERVGPGRHVVLGADLGPRERYRRFLAVRRGAVRVVLGTRSAAFAPVADLGLVAIWDDGDDLYAEPRAPYPHTRDVLLLRAHRAGAAALVAGFAPSVEALELVRSGWAGTLAATPAVVRATRPRVAAAGDDAELARDPAARAARLPTLAWRTARDGLAVGPVLVQVPRRGYQPGLTCQDCRAAARCPHCAGPLGRGRTGIAPACRWCARPAADWRCRFCGGPRLRAAIVGATRTAEELGRSFPGVPVLASTGEHVLPDVPDRPALVVATPGAEPIAAGGYPVVLLLDGWALLGRSGMRAGEEALRRWTAAAALARPGDAGGRVVVLADGELPAVQALLRWDPRDFADREATERSALRFPPATRLAVLDGPLGAAAALAATAPFPPDVELLGPVPLSEGRERLLIRVPRRSGPELAAALQVAAAQRSARRAGPAVRIQLDPVEPL